MAYEKKTVKKIIEEINEGHMYLPAIQRKYVWSNDQITKLMDSVMRGYPIGTFLFWKVKRKTINDKKYSLYKFINYYHDRDMYTNPPASSPLIGDNEYIYAVLDGQQRLTSLYISLQGSISRKLPRKHWNNSEAFPMTELYFNLHSEKKQDEDIIYEFKFLQGKDAKENKENKLWYRVKDILQYSPQELVSEVIVPNNWTNDKLAMDNIALLHSMLTQEEIINYFEAEEESMDNVLDIFVRINSGGTVLSKTDLLFSTVVSHWDKARDEIDMLLNKINKICGIFNFSNDFIIRSCLYVLDMPVTLKVENLKKENVEKIKNNWDGICSAVKDTVKLLDEFGFNSETLFSQLAVMPMVYYRFNNGEFEKESKNELKKYIIVAQLKQIFGASSNYTLTKIREALQVSPKPFKMENLLNIRFAGDRTLRYTAEEIDSMFDDYEIGAYTFMILSLLYPNLKYERNKFHQDHMHPHTAFEGEKLDGLVLPDESVIDDEKKEIWRRRRNTLANLQLLEGGENESKNAMPLTEWLKDCDKNSIKYLPDDVSYELSAFEEFMKKRQELMSEKLKKILL